MLNNEQLNAVNTVSGPVLLVAGPGSGKTMVIASRIHHMISDCNISPENILVVTFSRAAALNMKQRYLSLSSNTNSKVSFGTFHSIFFQILKTEYGYRAEDILTQNDSLKLIMSFFNKEQAALANNMDFVSEIAAEISYIKSKGVLVDNYTPRSLPKNDFLNFYNSYSSYITSNKKLDFEDILIKTRQLLKAKPSLTDKLTSKYKYILVDEFQDINPLQYEIVKMLAAPDNNLFVVGDDDQAIYAFRGATPSIMKQFVKDYPGSATIRLNINFRSAGEILRNALQVINHNTNRFKKELVAHKPAGEDIAIKYFDNYTSELNAMAESIHLSIKAGVKPSEIAIIVRTHGELISLTNSLVKQGIPTSAKLSSSIYKDKYVTPVLSMLAFAKGQNTRENFLQFYNKPVRYIKREYIDTTIVEPCELRDLYIKSESFYVVKAIDKLIFDINVIQDLDPASAIHYIRKIVGYDNYLKKEAHLSLRELDEKLSLLSLIEHKANEAKSYTAFLEQINSENGATVSEPDKKSDQVINIITTHASKGLEFESVYIPNCIEGNFPHKRSYKPEEIEEERRLFYVAMTRAKSKLWISFSESTQGREGRICSRFVSEILEGLPLPEVGTLVKHNVFGAGTIIYTKEPNITVKFDRILVPKILNYRVCLKNKSIELKSKAASDNKS